MATEIFLDNKGLRLVGGVHCTVSLLLASCFLWQSTSASHYSIFVVYFPAEVKMDNVMRLYTLYPLATVTVLSGVSHLVRIYWLGGRLCANHSDNVIMPVWHTRSAC